MNARVLICTDLDRTLLPNGEQPESPEARPRFAALVDRPEVALVYVTGRRLGLVHQAITDFGLPRPQFLIADVGTTVYEYSGQDWRRWLEWDGEIGGDWNGMSVRVLMTLFADLNELELQEIENQGRFKLSYYVSLSADHGHLLAVMRQRLEARKIHAGLVRSVDDAMGVGLLDILPASAGKLRAVEFLMEHLGYPADATVFAGDSGNDLEVLTSSIRSVLVANASREVKHDAKRMVERLGHSDSLYLAKGGFMGMNGNYSAGILEGVCHFLPFSRQWMDVE